MDQASKYALLVILFILNIMASAQNSSKSSTSVTSASPNDVDHIINKTLTNPDKSSLPHIAMRTIYVISAVSALVIVYLIVRAVCFNRKRSKTKRYGVLKNNRADGMELHPLSEADDDDDDDDDDTTVFDLRQQRKVKP